MNTAKEQYVLEATQLLESGDLTPRQCEQVRAKMYEVMTSKDENVEEAKELRLTRFSK